MNMQAPFDYAAYKRKPFAWSYSALTSFETCPKKYAETSLWKRVTDDQSDGGNWGQEVHKAFSARIRNKTPFPLGMRHYEDIVVHLERHPGTLYDEQKMALNREHQPVDFFARDVWFRSIIDAGLHHPQDTMRVFDWKTGKIKQDDAQLVSQAAMIFHQMPEIENVGACFVWLKDKEITKASFTRKQLPDMWNSLLPRVHRLEVAWNNVEFEPRPGPLCAKYCPVKNCQHNGRR